MSAPYAPNKFAYLITSALFMKSETEISQKHNFESHAASMHLHISYNPINRNRKEKKKILFFQKNK